MAPFQYDTYRPDTGSILELMQAGPRARAAAARASGDAQARALVIKGDNYNHLAGSLGQIASGVTGQILQYQADKPRREMEQLQLDAAKREQAEDQALRALFSREEGPSAEELYKVVGPKRGTEILKGFAALRTENQKAFTSTQELIGSVAGGILALPAATQADAYTAARTNLIQRRLIRPEDAPEQFSPELLRQIQQSSLAPKEQIAGDETRRHNAAMEARPVNVPTGGTLVNPVDGSTVATGAAKPVDKPNVGSFEDYVMRKFGAQPTPQQIEQARESYRLDQRTTINVGTADTDPTAIAEGIIRGELPPTLTDYGRGVNGAVASVLAKKGYNLATARTDWNATQKHFATLNGAQQTRIRQAVDTAYHALDVIDGLADQWKGGRYPVLNKMALAAAKNGVMGKEAQTIATQLEAQITDLTSELGNVYMGGNSPTDHALSLAAKNLSANWSQDVLKQMTKLARTNLQIRQNAIANVGAIGVSGTNTYAPPSQETKPAAAPAAGPGISYQDYLNSRKKGGG